MRYSANIPRYIALISLHSCPLGNLGARDTGGMSVYIREVALQFASKGFHVDIFTRGHNSHSCDVTLLAEGVRLVHIKAGETQEVVDKIALHSHINTFNQGVYRFAKENNSEYSYIFSHYWLSGVSGQLLSDRWKIPHIVMFHTLGEVKNQIGQGLVEPDLRLQEEYRIIQVCDRIIASTDREKDYLCHLYSASADKIRVVPCGVNLEMFKPIFRPSPVPGLRDGSTRIILYVGRIDPLKGTSLLVEALSLIKADDGWICLIVGGDGSNDGVNQLQQQAIQEGIADKLIFTGPVPQEELSAYYSTSSVLVVPSYYESFGLVAIEALACGCPVIAGDVGDLKNIIKPGLSGDILKKLNTEELARTFRDWIKRSPRTAVEVSIIRETVAGFSWVNVSQELINEFEALAFNTAGAV
ncbi:MAG: glycosyltransferase family 1 protein [Dehalococcoidales bacterium]|jgi:D-inositol-3-phosphate glycosyltransferase|nr:glycosyltransferase family 1 protein [Dehalococcoidales bacterium]